MKEEIMKFKRYITEKKAELSGDQYKDKFISLLNKWDTDLSRMTKTYKSLKDGDKRDFFTKDSDGVYRFDYNKYKSNNIVKDFISLKKNFIIFRNNFESWLYTKILDNRKVKEETPFQTDVRKTGWDFYLNIDTYKLFPDEYIYDLNKHFDAPWLLDTSFRGNSRKTNITRYQNSWRKFKVAFATMVNYNSEKINDIAKDEQIQVSGVNIIIKNKKNNDNDQDKYIKKLSIHLRKAIDIIKKEGLSKAIKGFRIEFNFNPSTVSGLPNGGSLVSGAYAKETDTLYMFPLSNDNITDSTLIHEIGHRYWFRNVPNKAQKAWEDKINSRVVTIEDADIKKFFDMFFDEDKYSGFPRRKEIEKEVENKIKDPTLKIKFMYMADNTPLFSVEDNEDKYKKYMDFMIKRAKGEQIPLEWISDYGRTNPVEAFAEAFKIWVGGKKGKLGPWTRAFFKEIVSTGGSNIKENIENMNLIEKYLGEGKEVTVRSNKLQKLIRSKLYQVTNYGYSMESGFHAAIDDKEMAKKLAKDMEDLFKIKTKIEKIGNSWVVLEKEKELSRSVKFYIKNPIFNKVIGK